MAGNSKYFETGLKKWKSLKEMGNLSKPLHEGNLAILCSMPVPDDESTNLDKKIARKDSRTYRKEALKIAEIALRRTGQRTEIIFNPSRGDFAEVLTNPSFSSVLTIGDGSLSDLYLATSKVHFDWYDAIIEADHLKTGEFTQRHCGHYARTFNFPLGGFVVKNQRDVVAPAGQFFRPSGLQHPDNAFLVRPLEELSMKYEVFKEAFNGTPPVIEPGE